METETEKLTLSEMYESGKIDYNDYYQPLFDKLYKFGLIALESEMQEIIEVVQIMLSGKAVAE